jgi:hypothetical protein
MDLTMDLTMATPPFIVKLSDNGHSTRHLHTTRRHGYSLSAVIFLKKTAEMESKEHKNRAMAEEARQKAESIVADVSDAKQGQAEIIKTRRTWSFISLLIVLVAFFGARNEHPTQNLMQSFNKTLSNLVPVYKMKTNAMAQNKRQMKKDSKQDDARMKQEAATQAKIAADLKDAEEAKQRAQAEKDAAQKAKKEAELLSRRKATQAKIAADLKDAEEAKQKAETEKDAASKAKKEAELLASQKADVKAPRREVRAFQTEHNIVDEIILLW